MANKVFTVKSTKKYDSRESLEVYKDIDVDSAYNPNYKYIEKPELSDFVAYLKAEDYIGSNDTSVFLVEPQAKTEETLSAIAVTYKLGYNRLMEMYSKFMQPYQYKVSKLVNVKAVQNSLHNIFTWTPGERIINPEFGSKLRQYLYEGITPMNTDKIVSEIHGCVLQWEPRVHIVDVKNISTINDTENNTLHLEITYTIPSLSEEQYKYSFYYNRSE